MASLYGSMSIAIRSLLAEQGALRTASNNIANVNTPGYSRQRTHIESTPPILFGNLQFGTGAALTRVESIRDLVLELRLHQETQEQRGLASYLGVVKQAEALFNETGGAGLQAALSAFFNSIQDLSTNPSSLPLRQAVLSTAENLAQYFSHLARSLEQIQRTADLSLPEKVLEANRLTGQIAALNGQIAGLAGSGQDAGSLVDQRDQLIRQLSGVMDVSVIDAGPGAITLSTSSGTALVVGNQSFELTATVDSSTGLHRIFSGATDLTGQISAGVLGGLLKARDAAIPQIQDSLDTLAAGLATAFNATHRAGFDLQGAAGVDFFVPPPASGAAGAFRLNLTDPALIAASSDGSPGNGENLAALLDVNTQPVAGSQKITDFYSRLVGRIGSDAQQTQIALEAQQITMRQLEDRRAAFSAVSLDEEAANMIRFQRAFQAAARVINVIDELTEAAVNLGRR